MVIALASIINFLETTKGPVEYLPRKLKAVRLLSGHRAAAEATVIIGTKMRVCGNW